VNEIKRLPFPQYLELDRYGSTDLKNMRSGLPALVRWKRENREDSEATRVGSAAHCLILTPDLFEDTYALKPEGMTFASKEGKEWKAHHEGYEILTHDETCKVREVTKAFVTKSTAINSLAAAGAGRVESSVLWDCKASGLRSKGRPDWYDDEAVYDLKVSRHAMRDLRGVAFRAFVDGWMHQLAHNRAGLQANGVNIARGRLVVVSPKPPCEIHLWLLEVKPDALDLLEMENVKTRSQIAECEKSGVWPATPNSWQLIEPPASADVDMLGLLDGAEVVDEQ